MYFHNAFQCLTDIQLEVDTEEDRNGEQTLPPPALSFLISWHSEKGSWMLALKVPELRAKEQLDKEITSLLGKTPGIKPGKMRAVIII